MLRNVSINYILIVAFIIFFQLSALGQENKSTTLKLDLEKSIDMALKSSENFQIQDNEVKRNKYKYNIERSEILPQINGELGWSNNFEYPDVPAAAHTKDYDAYSGVAISQKIFTFGKVYSTIKAAKDAIEVSKHDKETLRQKIIYDTKLAYYTAYLAKRTLEIAEDSYQNALKNKEILQKRSFTGRVSKHDNIKISADLAARKPTVNNARTSYYSAIETLKVILGVEQNKKLELTEGFSDQHFSFERDSMALALYNNQPAIKSLAKTIFEKESLVNSKKAAYYPEVSAFASWSHKGNSNNSYMGKNSLDDYGIAGLKVDIPFWTGGKTNAELEQARIDKKNAELRYQQGKEDYLLELDKALNEYKGYVETLESNQEAVRLAEKAFELSQEIFQSGQISVTDLNDSELKLTNEKLNKEITLFNISITLAKIERLTLIR